MELSPIIQHGCNDAAEGNGNQSPTGEKQKRPLIAHHPSPFGGGP